MADCPLIGPVEPVSAPKGWSAEKAVSDVRTADIINFPGIPQECPKKSATVQHLPERSSEEKAQLRITLAAIRAAMSVEQVQMLPYHRAVLARYSHLIEVYLEPQCFVDTKGLDADQAAERIVAAQKVALRMLLPTERDTQAGAVKVLTDAVGRTIQLQRTLAGLDKVAAATSRPGEPNNPIANEDDRKARIIDLEALVIADLRAVPYGMEILDRHHRKRPDAPMPPPPEPIDDLLASEPVATRELEDEDVPPR
jgi:hypothetical protein